MLNHLRDKIRQFLPGAAEAPSIRCFGSDTDGAARSAFLVAVLADDAMSEIFGRITFRFDRISRTLTVAEAQLTERWRHLSICQDMLAAAVHKCAARQVVLSAAAHPCWTKLLGREVAGARVLDTTELEPRPGPGGRHEGESLRGESGSR
jgi:hypothetical protein